MKYREKNVRAIIEYLDLMSELAVRKVAEDAKSYTDPKQFAADRSNFLDRICNNIGLFTSRYPQKDVKEAIARWEIVAGI